MVSEVFHSVNKIDSLGLACGVEKFTDDIDLRDMLYVKMLSSPYAHAKIKNIDTSKAESVPGVKAVLTYKNVPRVAHTTAGQGFPEPSPYDTYILDSKVRFVGDRVAFVCAETEKIAEQALKLINLEYEVLKPVFDPRDALKENAPIIHNEKDAKMIIPMFYDPTKNICAAVNASVGDINKGLKESDIVIENEYEIHYASHCCIETHIAIAYIDERGRIVIRTSTQVPFHVRRIIYQCTGIPIKDIRVIKPRIGGGFGGKQEILLEDIVALLAYRLRKPVKFQYTRQEEFVSSRTRHPQIIKLKTGIKKNGIINAIDMDVLMNNGAYGAHALTVGCNSGSKCLPMFNKATDIRFQLKTVYTNLPVGGAYRGYGATQSYFAMGVQVDELSEAIGMDVVEVWRKNHIKEGEGSPVFQMLGEGREGVEMKIGSCGLPECINIGLKKIDWYNKRRKKIRNKNKVRGVGMVCLMQGSSIPEIDMGAASIKMNDDGSFNLLVGATDLGTGSDTILAQIAAETLGCKTEDFIVYSSDTDITPFDVGAYASSTTYLSGAAVMDTANKVKEQIIGVALEMMGLNKKEVIELQNRFAIHKKSGKKVSFREIAYYSLYQKNQFQIGAIASKITHKSPPPFAAHFAEVEVDEETGKVKVVKYVSVTDCGIPINPRLAEGQVEGAVINGISYALTEEYIFNKTGRIL
ncbi:MAG: molybdopterin cofactor-binding domain-containing protein, partial [Candidatus Hydrogenedentota bacterium]